MQTKNNHNGERHTHPFDKMYPIEESKWLRQVGWKKQAKSALVQMQKRIQKKKQREYDRRLENQEIC